MHPEDKARELSDEYKDLKDIHIAYYSAMRMYKWYSKEVIERVIKWLEEQDYGGWIENPTDELIDEFKKIMQDE